jgi:hypothetical protein
MGRPNSYACKNCNFTGSGPGDLGRHYSSHPSHRPTYKKIGGVNQRVMENKPNGHAAAEIILTGPFAHLATLKGKFEIELERETKTIEQLKTSLADHERELGKIKQALDVLGKAQALDVTAPEPEPVRFAAPMTAAS